MLSTISDVTMDENPYQAPQSPIRFRPTVERTTWLIIVMEVGAAVALVTAAQLGDATVRSNGLHVSKLAYDNICFTILAVCLLSCVLAAVLCARITRSRNRIEVLAFLAAVVLGWLAASAFANGRVTFNGASTQWVSWSATLWLAALLFAFLLRGFRPGAIRNRVA